MCLNIDWNQTHSCVQNEGTKTATTKSNGWSSFFFHYVSIKCSLGVSFIFETQDSDRHMHPHMRGSGMKTTNWNILHKKHEDHSMCHDSDSRNWCFGIPPSIQLAFVTCSLYYIHFRCVFFNVLENPWKSHHFGKLFFLGFLQSWGYPKLAGLFNWKNRLKYGWGLGAPRGSPIVGEPQHIGEYQHVGGFHSNGGTPNSWMV